MWMSARPLPPTVTPILLSRSAAKCAASMVPDSLPRRTRGVVSSRTSRWLRHPSSKRRQCGMSNAVAPLTGLEPATVGVETRCSIQLSYRGAVEGRPPGVGPDTLRLRFGLRAAASHRALESGVVGVAQLVRAPGCGPGGRGFESPQPPQFPKTTRIICLFAWAGRSVTIDTMDVNAGAIEQLLGKLKTALS